MHFFSEMFAAHTKKGSHTTNKRTCNTKASAKLRLSTKGTSSGILTVFPSLTPWTPRDGDGCHQVGSFAFSLELVLSGRCSSLLCRWYFLVNPWLFFMELAFRVRTEQRGRRWLRVTTPLTSFLIGEATLGCLQQVLRWMRKSSLVPNHSFLHLVIHQTYIRYLPSDRHNP